MKIIGPCWYNFIKYKDKIIHNFGDIHNKKTPCKGEGILFQDWLDQFIETHKSEIVDVFFELPLPKKTKPYILDLKKSTNSYMKDTILYFLYCVTLINKKRHDMCKYKNARFHMTDFRNNLLYDSVKAPNLNVENFVIALYYFLSFSKSKRDEIKEIFNNLCKNVEKEVKDLVDLEISTLFELLAKEPNAEFDIKIARLALLMDLFLLIRICRTYSTQKRSDFNNESVSLAVSYTGVEHAKNLSLLFTKLGAEVSPPISRTDGKTGNLLQCVNLK